MKMSLNKISAAIETKKEKIIEKIQNSNPWFLVLNWLLTNWVTILLVCIVSIFGIRNYLQVKDLQEMMLKKQIQDLNIDLKKAKLEKEKLLGRIEEFEKTIIEAKTKNRRVREDLEKMNTSAKKEKLLEYKDRLIRKSNL